MDVCFLFRHSTMANLKFENLRMAYFYKFTKPGPRLTRLAESDRTHAIF